MKRIINHKIFLAAAFICATAILVVSCKKDKDGSPEQKASGNPTATGWEVDSASNGTVIILKGSGLGKMQSAVFNKNGAPASLNPNLNTDHSIVLRVPDTAAGGLQQVVLTNSIGKTLSVDFKVIALATVSGASSYSFLAGENITLTGRFMDDVSSVVYTGTSTSATIVSKTKTSVTITMPATTASSVKLSLTNASGLSNATQEFINVAQTFVIFRDSYGPGVSDGSWGPNAISNTVAISGSASAAKTLPQGNWWVAGFAAWDAPNIVYDPAYKYLSFWIKGGLIDHTLYLCGDMRPGGFGNSDQSTPLLIPALNWTYFKIPIGPLNLWGASPAGAFKQLGFWIKGPDNADETFYFDDVFLVK